MNKTMTQNTQVKLLSLINELQNQNKALKDFKNNYYIGCGGYDLSVAISDLELVIKHLKEDVLQLDEDDEQ